MVESGDNIRGVGEVWVSDEVGEGVGGEFAALRCVSLGYRNLPSYIAFTNEEN